MTQFNAPVFDIERPSGQCAYTGRTLAVGEDYIAALVECEPAEKESGAAEQRAAPRSRVDGLGLRRVDISLESWERGHRPDAVFCHWRTTVAAPNERRRPFVDDAVLMDFLRRLGESDDPQRRAFRFVLCLILMRRKLLRYDGTRQRIAADPLAADPAQGVAQEWWIVTPKLDLSKGPMGKWHPTETLEVLDPRLDDAQVQQVTEQLGEVLRSEV